MVKLTREYLGLAGEYAVASELCRLGYYAQLTLGTRKKTDILIDTEARMMRVQVKSKQDYRWPVIQGVPDKDALLVLVDYEGKMVGQRPDFYVLSYEDWQGFIENDLAEDVATGRFRIDDGYLPVRVNKKGEDSWQGIALYPEDVVAYKEDWAKLESLLV